MDDQYDAIGGRYSAVKDGPLAIYTEIPTVCRLLGDLGGKTALDVACGTGYYTRLLSNLGAAAAEAASPKRPRRRPHRPAASAELACPCLREFSRPDYFAFLFSVSIKSLAAGPDEAGFWPVISWPSATV